MSSDTAQSESFFSQLTQWFFPLAEKSSDIPPFSCTFVEIEQHLFEHLWKKIANDTLLQEWKEKYQQAHEHDGPKREIQLIKLYLDMEVFFSTQSFPITDKHYTPTELRSSIAQDCPIQSLGEALRLLFLPEAQRLLLMYDIATRDIFLYLIKNLGKEEVVHLTTSSLKQTCLSTSIVTPTGIHWSTAVPKEALLTAEVAHACKRLSSACFACISSSFGDQIAAHVFERPYGFIHATYGTAFAKEFFSTLPESIADAILLSILTREELEQRLKEATQKEASRREIAESLLAKLKQKELELKSEKAHVEEKVKERTLELQQQHDRMDASINSLNLGLLMTDTTPEIIMVNSTAKRLLLGKRGLSGEALSWAYSSVTWKDVQETLTGQTNITDIIHKCLTQAKPTKIPPFLLHDRYIKIQITPIASRKTPDENISIIGTIVLVEDVTEAQLLERTRQEFFSIASHELRTPLTAIRGDTSIILQYLGNQIQDPTVKTLITDIHDASVRLLKIVNDFLSVSRLEQKRIEFVLQSFNMLELLQDVSKELHNSLEEKHLQLIYSFPDTPLPLVCADKDRTKEVILNLMGNAIKYTDTGSITLSCTQEGPMICTRIKDTGHGIPKEQQGLVFRKFQQASNNILTRDNSRSTGLGLYISKLLVEGMNGTIGLESSETEKGSTFMFCLPTNTNTK